MLINLISNAIKFSNRDGCVVVSALQERRHIVITVEDGGIGISNEDLPRLGEVFFQAKSTYDRLGEGTCVTVRLPLDCEAHRNGVTPIPISQARVARADQPSLGHAVEDAVPDATTVQVRKRA